MGSKLTNMKIFIIAMLGVGLSLGQNARETWVTICTDDSGNECCADAGMGDTADTRHDYWIIRSQSSWSQQDFACRMERPTAKLAVFESQRENDCVTKYLLDEFEDATSMQYAIGIKADERYPGIYEWDRVDISDDNKDAASLSFKNWVPTAPTGLGCGVMSVGIGDPNNGRWTDVDCHTGATYYAVCEDYPTP